MIDHFAELIFQLGEELELPLHLDAKRIAAIGVDHKFTIQIEEVSPHRFIQIGAFLVDVPPGKYRVNLFRDTLRYNFLSPRIGTFSFSAKANKLSLHDYLPFASMSVEKLKIYLDDFIELGFLWIDHIQNGTTHVLVEGGLPKHLVGTNHSW